MPEWTGTTHLTVGFPLPPHAMPSLYLRVIVLVIVGSLVIVLVTVSSSVIILVIVGSSVIVLVIVGCLMIVVAR
jgi:hypothetical protein